jgi:hypothetical protein
VVVRKRLVRGPFPARRAGSDDCEQLFRLGPPPFSSMNSTAGGHRGDCEEHFGFATLGSFRKTRGTQRLSAFSVYERAPGTEPVWRRPITEIEREPPAFSPIARYSGR